MGIDTHDPVKSDLPFSLQLSPALDRFFVPAAGYALLV